MIDKKVQRDKYDVKCGAMYWLRELLKVIYDEILLVELGGLIF